MKAVKNRFRATQHPQSAAWLMPVVLVIAVVALSVACVIVLPGYLVDRDLGAAAQSKLTGKDLLEAKNDVRATLLQALGGAFFLATAFFTWRQIRLSQRQLQVSEDEQVASRFIKAIEQLGSETLDMRLGGIYALERIARDSERDHGPIVEVLAAFVRERVPWPPVSSPTLRWLSGRVATWLGGNESVELPEGAGRPPPDVQAALTVLGRRNLENEARMRPELNLSRLDLRGVDLRNAELGGALLNGTHLEVADLRGVRLNRARLVEAHLTSARLRDADLSDAKLIKAHVERARLFGANLQRAELMGAHLQGARLNETNLEGAKFRGAHLEGTYFGRARLDGASGLREASSDGKTAWPDGFRTASA